MTLRTYRTAAAAAAAAFAVGALLLSIALPFSDYDSFAFGDWSRAIAHGGSLDPITAGQLGSERPLYYLFEGGLWSITGVNFTAAHLLSLAFVAALGVGVWWLTRASDGDGIAEAVGIILLVAIPSLAVDSIAAKSDIPAAAGVAITAALALRPRTSPALIAAAAAASILTKPTVIAPLAVLGLYLAWRSRRVPVGLAAGFALGFVYEVVMALRFHTGVIAYLRKGTSDGLWAQRAAADRWHAFLRADVLGESLRLPLTFGLIYALARAFGVRHRIAGTVALGAGLAWSIGGPVGAGVSQTPESVLTLLGFAVLTAAVVALPDADAPSVEPLRLGLALGLPPLALWLYATAYFDRLAATAWPGLVLIMTVVVVAGARALFRYGRTATLAPIAVLGLAAWMGIASLDGLHGSQWAGMRELRLHGLRNQQETMNIVLPALQEALAVARPVLGAEGKLIGGDPRFDWFVPNVTTTTPEGCADVAGYKVFILLTADESIADAQAHGNLATPDQWAACRGLHELTDGSNGYAVFKISKPS